MPAPKARRQRIAGFPPIAEPSARILVLGSMPSAASLAKRQYYAHPRNQFWAIVGEICGFDAVAPYPERVVTLRATHIAVWDVMASCIRAGSLDSGIDEDSIIVNQFARFLARHPHIERICFNGRKAEAAWRRHVLKQLPAARKFRYFPLPSTSPAHAGWPYSRKLRAWRRALAV